MIRIFAAFFLVFFSFQVITYEALGNSKSCGEFTVVKGNVLIRSDGGPPKSATLGSPACPGDSVFTRSNDARAKIEMPDGNELNLSPKTQIQIEKYENDEITNRKKVSLNVLSGRLRASTDTKNKYDDTDENGESNYFEVRTRSAVAGVRGTDFITSFSSITNETEVITVSGEVTVGRPGPNQTVFETIAVRAGQRTRIPFNAPPNPPTEIPSQEIDQIDRESKAEYDGPEYQTDVSSEDPNSFIDNQEEQNDEINSEESSNHSDITSDSEIEDEPNRQPSSRNREMIDYIDTPVGQDENTLLPTLPGDGILPDFDIPTMTETETVPICEFCDRVIQNTPSSVDIFIPMPEN